MTIDQGWLVTVWQNATARFTRLYDQRWHHFQGQACYVRVLSLFLANIPSLLHCHTFAHHIIISEPRTLDHKWKHGLMVRRHAIRSRWCTVPRMRSSQSWAASSPIFFQPAQDRNGKGIVQTLVRIRLLPESPTSLFGHPSCCK